MQTPDHIAILEQYRQTQTGDGWHTAPDDGYLYDHLAYHLREAGLIIELKGMFADHSWLRARVQQTGYGGYIADLQVAWEVSYQEVLKQIEAGEEFTAFLECIHLVLIETSLRSWAESRTPSIVARAVEVGFWSSEKALSLAELIPDEQRRAVMYAALAKTGKLTSAQTDEAKTEALDAAKKIEYSWSRASTLSMLSEQTAADQQLEAVSAALAAALEAADGMFGSNGFALWQLIENLPDDLIDRALQGVLALKNPDAKAWALSALTKRVPQDRRYELLEKGLEAALQIRESDVIIANALAQLANQLTGDLVARALDAALSLNEGNWRPRAIVGLMDKLDVGQVNRTLESMLTISDEWWRADGLMRIIEHSTGDTQRRALFTLLSTQHGETKEKIRGWIDYFGTPQLIRTAIDVVQQFEESDHRTQILDMLGHLLAMKNKEAKIASIADLQSQAEAFLSEAEQLEGAAQSHQRLNAYRAIFKIEDETIKNQLMERLRSVVGNDQQVTVQPDDEALDKVLQIEYEEDRSQRLAGIAKQLPENLIPQALDAALRLDETLYRDWALDGLAERLNTDSLHQALEGRFDHDDTIASVYCLQALASSIEESVRFSALNNALDSVLNINNLWWRIEPLERLLPALKGEGTLIERGASDLFQVAQQLRTNEMTVRATAIAIEYLKDAERSSALNATLDQVWTYEDTFQTIGAISGADDVRNNTYSDMSKWQRTRALGQSLKHLDAEQKQVNLTKAVDLVLSIQDEGWLESALKEIIPYLEGEFWGQMLDASLKIKNGRTRAEAILNLIDNGLPEIYIPQTLDATMAIDEPGWRASTLISIAKRMDEEQRSKILMQAYGSALEETQEWLKIHLLVELANLRISDSLEQGIGVAREISDEWYRAQTLALFLPFVEKPTDLLTEIRQGMLSQLNVLRSKKRSDFFWHCSDKTIFTTPIISTNQLTMLVSDLLNVHQNWRWG